MKGILHATSLALTALLLCHCAFREQEAPDTEAVIPFELFAESLSSKTVNDGMSTKWETGDKISVFHSRPGGKTYTADGVFEIDDAEKGHAVGTVSGITDGTYDWFLFYPGSTPAPSEPGGSVNIASEPVQQGYGSRAHLAGPGFPLGGTAAKVAYTATPSVTLHPLLSVLEVNFSNAQDVPLKVKSISFTAPELISGDFQLSWNGVFTKGGKNSGTVSLSVEGGSLLPKDGSAKFYLGIKPFSAAAGQKLSLQMVVENADGKRGSQTRTISLPAARKFEAGLIKTLNISFDGIFVEPGREFGIYGWSVGEIVHRPGLSQLSVRESGQKYDFRIIYPVVGESFLVSGLPATMVEGARFQVNLTRYMELSQKQSVSLDVSVALVEPDRVHLLSDDGLCLVVKSL